MIPLELAESTDKVIQNTLDLVFPVHGNTLPYQHTYSLFSAISRQVSELHASQVRYRMTSIPLIQDKQQTLWGKLPKQATLRFRFQLQDFPYFLSLTGQSLDLDGHQLHLGIPKPYRLSPASALLSRIVVIKGYLEPETFLVATQRQLAVLDIPGQCLLVPNTQDEIKPRVLVIKDKRVVGFSVAVTGLNAESSLKLQAYGLGGRGKFGAGFFQPVKGQVLYS